MVEQNDWEHFHSRDELPEELLSAEKLSNLHSQHPLEKIRSNLLIGIVVGIATTLVYLIILYYFDQWLIRAPLLIVLGFNLFILRSSLLLHSSISNTGLHEQNLLQELSQHRSAIKKWWKIQEQFSLFVYPFAVAAGFLAGGILGSGDRELTFIQQREMLILLGTAILILTPLCFFSARYIFRYYYGQHLSTIEKNIESLRSMSD